MAAVAWISMGAGGGSVAYDNDTQQLQIVTTNTTTFSHTTSGANRALVVYVILSGISQSVSTITYAGTSLALIGARDDSDTSGTRIEAWGLAAPASGANNVIVTLSASNAAWDVSAVSFTGAHQTGGSTTFNGFTGADADGVTASVSVNITTTSSDMVTDCSASNSNNGTTSSPGTQIWQDNSGATNTQGQYYASTGTSETLTETWDVISFGKQVVGLNITKAP